MRHIYPHTTQKEYEYIKAKGYLWVLYPKCTGNYKEDAYMFRDKSDIPEQDRH